MTADAIVFVVDDDRVVREVLNLLIESFGLDVQTFPSAEAFLAHDLPDRPSCLMLDVRMPGRSGFDLQEELNRAGQRIPIIFITGHGDVGMRARALKAGAVDFLQKPFQDQELLDAIHSAFKSSQGRVNTDPWSGSLGLIPLSVAFCPYGSQSDKSVKWPGVGVPVSPRPIWIGSERRVACAVRSSILGFLSLRLGLRFRIERIK